VSLTLTRRRFSLGAAATVSGLAAGGTARAAAASPNPSLAWSPQTLCGLNVGFGTFWGRDIAPGQYELLARYGISFVRGIYFCYLLGGYMPGQLDTAVHTIVGLQPFAADPTQISLFCHALPYAPPVGDTLILSAPLVYRASNGANLTLPARTPLKIAGATKGTGHDNTGYTLGGEIRVRPLDQNGKIADSGRQPVKDCNALHASFFREGKTLRRPIDDYVKRAQQWLAQGFAFDHGGLVSSWSDLFAAFGQSNVQPMREQEWQFFAGLDWNPRSVLISDENEPVWPGAPDSHHDLKATPAQRWAAYKPYFQDVLYPQMRRHFPRHTLGFGNPDWDGPATALHMDWWPKDRNTLLRVHYYPKQGAEGIWQLNPDNRSEMDGLMNRVADVQRRLDISQVHFQEFGVRYDHPNRSNALKNIRQAIQARRWSCAVWSASDDHAPKPDSYHSAGLSANGLWQPAENALGAFGMN